MPNPKPKRAPRPKPTEQQKQYSVPPRWDGASVKKQHWYENNTKMKNVG